MIKNRWSQHDGNQYHPDAVRLAQHLEGDGWTQHGIDELVDGEHVLVVNGHDGSHAPCRYLKAGDPVGDHGEREQDVLISFPDSSFQNRLEHHKSMIEHGGKRFSRIAIFRPSQTNHHKVLSDLYEARKQMHVAEAKGHKQGD